MRFRPFFTITCGWVLTSFLGCSWWQGDAIKSPKSREAWVDAVLAAEDKRDAADPLLALALERDDPVVRMFAYRAFGRIGDPNAIALLLQNARQESDSRLRTEAVNAIGGTESPRILPALESFVLDPSFDVRRSVARAIGRARSDQTLKPLFDMLGDADPDVRAEAALGIARRLAADPGLVTPRSLPGMRMLATAMTKDTHQAPRAAAAYALSKVKQAEFVPAFVAALSDEDENVRCFAAVALQSLPLDEPATKALITALGDARYTVVVEAVKALGSAPNSEVVQAFSPLLARDGAGGHSSHQVRAVVATALGAMGKVDGSRALIQLALADRSPSVRADALDSFVAVASPEDALRRCEHAASVTSVTAGDAASFLRSRAAAAAAAIPGEGGFSVIAKLLSDSSPAVRAAAIATLPKWPAHRSEATVALEKALAERDVAPLESAATAIAEMKLDSLVPALLEAVSRTEGPEHIEARISILKALGSFERLDLAEKLKGALLDAEPEVRRVAADQVAKLGGLLPERTLILPPPPPAIPRAGVDFLHGKPRPVVEIVTNQGAFKLELLVEDAPHHCKAFLERCRTGFYDGLGFHRMVPGFVIQGLDPRGDGYGTGGASLRAENNDWRYDRGIVGMPDAGKDTGGCQIFITYRLQPKLDDRYTIFARVVEGMENVDRLDVGDHVEYVLAPPAD